MMNNAWLTIGSFALLLGSVGCTQGGPDSSQPPNPPRQELAIPTEHSGAKYEDYRNRMNDLISIKGAIEEGYQELQRNQSPRPPDEPVFSRQLSAQEKTVVERCKALEDGAKALLDHAYLRDHRGESADAEDLLNYAREIRQKIQPAT